jgi:hypothetical protein
MIQSIYVRATVRCAQFSSALALSLLIGCSATPDRPEDSPGGAGGALFSGGAPGLGAGGTSSGGGAPARSGGAPQTGTGGATTAGGCGANKAFPCMAPPMLDPIARGPASQWTYQEIAGATCRDGSPAGFYTRFTDASKKLLIYMEQGGACFNAALCGFNPATVADSITGRTFNDVISGMKKGVRQEPPKTGIFDYANPANPYKDWNAVWVPYCTGDAFGGSNPSATVPGVDGTQHFVGYTNMQKFVGHIVPTFKDAERVVLTGTSAGSFGAGINYNQVQDAFGAVPVTLIMDSGVPFADDFMSPCLQKQWRDLWKLDAAMPPDCTDCRHPDGGGFINLVFYSAKKYPTVKLGVISVTEDDIMRFFFGFGENNCTQGGSYAPGKYTQGLTNLRQSAAPYRSQFASYYIPGINHMYSQFDDFYKPLAGGVTLVSWVNDVLGGTAHDVGP